LSLSKTLDIDSCFCNEVSIWINYSGFNLVFLVYDSSNVDNFGCPRTLHIHGYNDVYIWTWIFIKFASWHRWTKKLATLLQTIPSKHNVVSSSNMLSIASSTSKTMFFALNICFVVNSHFWICYNLTHKFKHERPNYNVF